MRRSSLIISAVFHGAIFIIAVVGLPFLARREFIIPPPITVDLIDIAKITQTNNVTPKPVPPPEKPEPPKPENKPPPPAPQNTATVPAPPVKEPPKPEDKKEMAKETKAETVDENALPDKNKKPKKDDTKKAPPRDFASVLKNLAVPKDKATDMSPDAKNPAPPAPGQNAPLGEKMTMSEEDALRGQLEKCWNVPIGAKDAENIAVDIFMVINPDRTLREAKVVEMMRYNTDAVYRAVADSALRAVRSTSCSPFELPPDKYNLWNTITVTFNPKDMF
jgi:outer membrane biosynthesis protein TonB